MNDIDQATPTVQGYFGRVTDVKCVRSLGITRIIIEVPAETHVEATRMLFDKDVFMLAPHDGHGVKKYGPLTVDQLLGAMTGESASSDQNTVPPAIRQGAGRGLVPQKDLVNATRWLGIHCQERDFMAWLGANSASEAAAIVRERCNVSSRADIDRTPQAKEIFMNEILARWENKEAFV